MRSVRYVPLVSLAVALVMLLGPVGLLLGATYSNYMVIRVFNNSTNVYGVMPVLVTINNTQLVELGYINSTGLNTNLQEGAINNVFMVAESRLGSLASSFASGQVRTYYYRLNNLPGQIGFPVMVGVGGNMTVDDAPTLELGNNFSVELDGYVETSAGSNKNLVYKEDAFKTYISAEGDVTAVIPVEVDNSTGAGARLAVLANTDKGGQRYDNFPAVKILSASFRLDNGTTGGDTGTITAEVRSVIGDTLLGTLGSINANVLGAATWYTFDSTPVTVPSLQDIRIVVSCAGAMSVGILGSVGNVKPGVMTIWVAGWTDTAGKDISLKYVYELGVTAAGVPSGEHIVQVATNTTWMSINVDGTQRDQAWLGTNTTPDNGNEWRLMENESLIYMDELSIYVGGVRKGWWKPVTMIDPDSVPDRTGNGNTGTINWGANPTPIEITIGGLLPFSTLEMPGPQAGDPPLIFEVPESLSIYEDPTETGAGLPLFELFERGGDSLGWTAANTYAIIGMLIPSIAMIFAVGVATGSLMLGFLFGALMLGVAAGTTIIAPWIPAVIAAFAIMLMYVLKRA